MVRPAFRQPRYRSRCRVSLPGPCAKWREQIVPSGQFAGTPMARGACLFGPAVRYKSVMAAPLHPPAWKTLLAFAIIYLVWGSTFLAIRVGVREVPPFLLAAMRFLAAGLVLYVWTVA